MMPLPGLRAGRGSSLAASGLAIAASAWALTASGGEAGSLCQGIAGIRELVACVAAHMPEGGSGGYVPPLAAERAAWQATVQAMLADTCEPALPAELAPHYERRWLGGRTGLCVLVETLDADGDGRVDRGWGTFAVASRPRRELHIQVPHPLYDIATETQALAVFKGVDARSFLLAGSHRDANPARSTCQPSTGEGEADAGHNDSSLFFIAMQSLFEFYNANGKAWTAIQFHGMGASSCPGVDAFMTYGFAAPPKPGDKILDLRANIAARDQKWVITVPGDSPACNLTGGTNVGGRLLNNVPADQVCATGATAYSGKFIHIEQKTNLRAAIADWIAAINATWK